MNNQAASRRGGPGGPGARDRQQGSTARQQRTPQKPKPQKAGSAKKPAKAGTKKAAAPSARKPVKPTKAGRPVRGARGQWPMGERSILPTVLGIPPVAAVGLGAVATALGVVIDLVRAGGLGLVFTICHLAGCTLAVAWVRRTGLFGPMVQPPLLVALSVPAVVLLGGAPTPGQGVAERLLVVGAPLVNAFPVMAWTTGVAVLLGMIRIVTQRPEGPGWGTITRNEPDEAPAEARRSRSPRRS